MDIVTLLIKKQHSDDWDKKRALINKIKKLYGRQ